MKFSERITKSLVLILFVTLVLALLSSLLVFNNSLNSFLTSQRKSEFEQIAEDIEKLIQTRDSLTSYSLANYAKNKKINISYFLEDFNFVRNFIGVEEYDSKSSKLVSEKYNLYNSDNMQIGYLNISYIENIFEYDQSIKTFYYNLLKSYLVILLSVLIIVFISSSYINKSLSGSIVDLKNKTRDIRKKKYTFSKKKYNIYELDELSEDLSYLANTLEMQEKYRADYARDIAHELRTPLTNLLLHLEGVKDEVIDFDKSTIDLLLSEVVRLKKMTDDLETSFNNTEKSSILNIEKVNLSDIIKNVTNSFLPLMNEKNIILKKNLDDSIFIETDIDKMTQILSNILSNAIKAIGESGTISVSTLEFTNRYVLSISDTGIGMRETEIDHIFERFYRIDNVRNTKVSGSGLGLSIVKNYLDLLKYNIKVNSTVNVGSEFIITIKK